MIELEKEKDHLNEWYVILMLIVVSTYVGGLLYFIVSLNVWFFVFCTVLSVIEILVGTAISIVWIKRHEND